MPNRRPPSRSGEPVDQPLQIFLPAALRLRVELLLVDVVGEVVEALLAGKNVLAELALPAGIAVVDELLQRAVLDDRLGVEQRPRRRVHRADMRVEQVVGLDRLAADLGVEVHAAGLEAAGADESRSSSASARGTFMRELVGVPAEKIVAAVQVERAEDAERAGELDLVLERMAGEDRVVLLDVDLDLVLEDRRP